MPMLARRRADSCFVKEYERVKAVEVPAGTDELKPRLLREGFPLRRPHLCMDEGGQLPCQLETLGTVWPA